MNCSVTIVAAESLHLREVSDNFHPHSQSSAVFRCCSLSSSSSWVSASSPVMVHGKKFPKVFFTLSENHEYVTGFPVTPCIMVLFIGDLVVATLSVGMSDSSDISSRSRVPVEVARSWPCFTGVDSLANLCFLSLSVHVPPGSHSRQGLDESLLLTLLFFLLRTFDSWFQPFRLKLSALCRSGFVRSLPQKGHFLLFFVSLV